MMIASTKADVLSVCWSGAFRSVLTRMPRRKDISDDLKETIGVAHQSGKGHKTMSKQFGDQHSTLRKVIHTWTTFATAYLEWTSQQVHIEVRLCNALTKCKKPKCCMSHPTGLSV